MTYQPSIPASTDVISVSQVDLQNNFTSLNTQFGVDHTALDAASDNGKHKKSTYIEQSSDPTTAADEGAVYSKQSSLTSDTQLFFRRESNGSVIEMTGLLGAVNGWTRLPSGILLKWNLETAIAGNPTTNVITFPTGANIPVFSAVYHIFLQPCLQTGTSDPDSFVYLAPASTITTTQFEVKIVKRLSSATATATFRWLAIGI